MSNQKMTHAQTFLFALTQELVGKFTSRITILQFWHFTSQIGNVRVHTKYQKRYRGAEKAGQLGFLLTTIVTLHYIPQLPKHQNPINIERHWTLS